MCSRRSQNTGSGRPILEPGDHATIKAHREQQNAPPNRVSGPHGTYVERGKPLPTWMSKGADGEPMRTTDFRDPKQAPVKVEVTDASAAKLGKSFVSSFPAGTIPRSGNTLADIHARWLDYAQRHGEELRHPGQMSPHAHLSSAARTAIDNSRHRQIAMTHNPTFNISGGDSPSMLAEAHRMAGRGAADLVRNMSVMES